MFLLAESNYIQLEYEISSEDEAIGFVQSKIEIGTINNQPVVQKETVAQVELDGLFAEEETTEIETILFKDKQIFQYEGISQENGKRSTISIRNVAGLIVLDYAEGKKKKVELLELSDFDCMSEELIDYFLSSGQDSATYKLFDLSRFDIEQVKISLREPETIQAADKAWDCQVVLIKNLNQSIVSKRWISNLAEQWIVIKEIETKSGESTLILLDSIQTNLETGTIE